MICANCGTENRAGRRFCLECGNPLAAGCPNCGTENEPQARFCGNCGTALGLPAPVDTRSSAAKSDPVAERRLVTVLFADLVGFTPFAEERDAEDVRDVLQRYSDLAREVVSRYGGTVEKFIGDAVMAVWGTPTAHEDDAERAVRAALELSDAVRLLGDGIQARAAVLTGDAAVNLTATDQGLLAGDLVNTAARLQSVAPTGAVLVGESTMRATSAAIAYEAAGDQALKGKAAPIPAWRALRVIAQRRGAGRTESLETPFVGRDEELRLLKDQLQLAGRDPRARLVSITGPAGIGKSRLAWELEKYLDGVVETVWWHRGRCPAYGEGVTFWALGEMVRGRARLPENADEGTTRSAIAATVAEWVTDEGEREWIEQSLLTLLGLGEPTTSGRELLFAAWRRFFEHVAARGTTTLVFEDLQWADPGLLDFIDHLLDWSRSVPLVVITLARPELFDKRPNWGAGRRTFTALALDPIPDSAMRDMLATLVPNLPEQALAAIVERADGIPLYAVETVRMLLADGRIVARDGLYEPAGELGNLEVPESLRSLIAARLDGLAPADRRLMQDASVLGQSFTVGALAALDGSPPDELSERLRRLVLRELFTIDEDPRSPERGQYAFMQSLIREVAYSTLARPERRERHLAAARYLESVGGDELAGVLAGHYVSAHGASTPGPEQEAVAGQARLALRGAAERAAALTGHAQAAAFLAQALSLTTEAAERAALLERHGIELNTAGRYETAERSFREAIELLGPTGDRRLEARLRGELGQALIGQGRVAEAIAALKEGLDSLSDDVDVAVRADMLAKLARAYYRNVDWPRSLEAAEEALILAEHNRLLTTIGEAMVTKGTALQMASRPLEALALYRAGLEMARRQGDVATEFRALANMGAPVAWEEGARAAGALTRQGIELARARGDLGQTVWHVGNLVLGGVFGGEDLGETLAMADELLAMDLGPSDRSHLIGSYIAAGSVHGLDVSAMQDELERAVDPQSRLGITFSKMFPATAAGDWQAASELGAQTAIDRPQVALVGFAIVAAAMSADAGQVRQMRDRIGHLPIMGGGDAAMRTAGDALLQALEGQVGAALPVLREMLEEQRRLHHDMLFGTIALAMLRVLGPQSPDARAAGEEALANYERMKAWPLAEQLRSALQLPEAAGGARQPTGAAEVKA